MEIHARIDEADIGQIRLQQQAIFTVPAYGDRSFEAEVSQIRVAPIIIDNVVTYTVVLVAENKDESLLPGMTAIVEITVAEPDGSGIGEQSK
jgi:HlyD family secretion protein